MTKPKQCHLLYLMCPEVVANYGIYDTQVRPLLQIANRLYGQRITMHLLSFMPIARFRKWYIQFPFRLYHKEFQEIRSDLESEGIPCRLLPLIAALPFLKMRLLELLVMLPLAIIQVISFAVKHRINLIHCRSYPAGLLAYLTFKAFGIPYIFDPRSLWVTERIVMGQWQSGSLAHWLWKKLEATIARNAKMTIVVSEPMRESYKHISSRVELIYTTAGTVFFDPPSVSLRAPDSNSVQELRSLSSEHTMLVFVTNGFNRWNNLDYLVQRYQEIRTLFEFPLLILLTRTPADHVYRQVSRRGLSREEVWVRAMGSGGVAAALAECDYGLLVRPEMPTMESMISVKFAEYLAAGLPVICDQHIGGAAQIVGKYGVGMLLSKDYTKNQTNIECLRNNYSCVSQHCRDLALSKFSADAHAQRYAQLYFEALE